MVEDIPADPNFANSNDALTRFTWVQFDPLSANSIASIDTWLIFQSLRRSVILDTSQSCAQNHGSIF